MDSLNDIECTDFHLVKIGEHTFVLEECKNHIIGLSKREHLHENEGMLFNFTDKEKKSFHMKECLFSLDIIFIENGVIKKIFHECPPCREIDCKRYEYNSSDTVIELLGGTCRKNNISEGVLYRYF